MMADRTDCTGPTPANKSLPPHFIILAIAFTLPPLGGERVSKSKPHSCRSSSPSLADRSHSLPAADERTRRTSPSCRHIKMPVTRFSKVARSPYLRRTNNARPDGAPSLPFLARMAEFHAQMYHSRISSACGCGPRVSGGDKVERWRMTARVLVTSAGNAPSNNLVRSLRAGPEPVFIAGCHDDQFVLKNSAADKNYLIPPVGHARWAHTLRHILEAEGIQVIIPTVDGTLPFSPGSVSGSASIFCYRAFPLSTGVRTSTACMPFYATMGLMWLPPVRWKTQGTFLTSSDSLVVHGLCGVAPARGGRPRCAARADAGTGSQLDLLLG